VRGAELFASREALLARARRNAICAEIGVATGLFSGYLLRATTPAKLHLIDLDFGPLLPLEAGLETGIAEERVELHQGDSAQILTTFPDRYFDWVYVDGDHSLEGVRRDIAALLPRLKADGVLYFNDYTKYSPLERLEYGVMEAVNELCLEQGMRLVGLALHGMGYFDVAVARRPLPIAFDPPAADVTALETQVSALSQRVTSLRFELHAARVRLAETEQACTDADSRARARDIWHAVKTYAGGLLDRR
jgi:hypothetical protein